MYKIDINSEGYKRYVKSNEFASAFDRCQEKMNDAGNKKDWDRYDILERELNNISRAWERWSIK